MIGVLQLAAFGAELSSEACRELGFSSNLLCSSCDLLGQFSLSPIEPFCRQCCQEEAQLESRKVRATSLNVNKPCLHDDDDDVILSVVSCPALPRSHP